MMLVKKILSRLNGLHYPQEYLCLAKGSFQQPLGVYLVSNYQIIKDITNQHCFVGYSPMVFAFSGTDWPASLLLIFSQQLLLPNGVFSKKDALAILYLKLVRKQAAGDHQIYYYEGDRVTHYFLSGFHQYINSVYNQWFNKKPGNVFLHTNLYKQVQVAYSVPRIISLITVCENELFNLFPTDLHGQPDEQHYIISLRTGGRACEHVEKARRLVLSQVHSDAYKMVYGLGKNHMQEWKHIEKFPFSQSISKNFKWPLPEHTLSYHELILLDSFTLGIHKIILFKIDFHQQLQPQSNTLAHIHNSYASWRFKNGLPGNYLLR